MVLLTPFSQGTHLLSVGRLIVVGDQAYHRCVISKFDDDIGAVCSCTVMCVQGVRFRIRIRSNGWNKIADWLNYINEFVLGYI